MKRMMLAALLLPVAAWAGNTRNDYVQQWPLALEQAQAGAYRLVLNEAIYRQATQPGLEDVEVFNGAGQPMPTALLPAARGQETAPVWQAVSWFPLPETVARDGGDLQRITRRDADGSVRQIETVVAASASARPGGWLVDTSAIRDDARALQLEWETPQAPLQLELRVEASDDLRSWSVLHAQVALVDLANAGQRLQQRRITLGGKARYLKLSPVSAATLPTLRQVSVELDGADTPPQWRWLQAQGKPDGDGYLFEMEGRFPVELVDIASNDNSAVEWTVFSRDRRDARWVRRAGPWVAFKLGGAQAQSAPQLTHTLVRDRYWRLVPAQAAAAPTLRWGYQDESLVFLAQGEPPFAVAAGSGRVTRPPAPLSNLLAAMREQRGAAWEPGSALLQAPAQALGGAAALQPARDWKSLLLWALLIVGAVLVAGFALSLMRASSKRPDGDRSGS